MTRISALLPACAVLVAACAPPEGPDVTQLIAPTTIETVPGPKPEDADGQCWGHIAGETRSVLEERTIEVEPATFDADGVEQTPAIFRKASVSVERTDPGRAFLRLCDDALTPELVAPLQRALSARGLYLGEITGLFDEGTAAAVQKYQKSQGLDSTELSVGAARQLGLIAVDLPEGDLPDAEAEPVPDTDPELPEEDVPTDEGADTDPDPAPDTADETADG